MGEMNMCTQPTHRLAGRIWGPAGLLVILLANAVPSLEAQTIEVPGGVVVLDVPHDPGELEVTTRAPGAEEELPSSVARPAFKSAPAILSPGESRVLETADDATCELVRPPQSSGGFGSDCVNQSPSASCIADAAARTVRVDAGIGGFCVAASRQEPIFFPEGPIRSSSAIGRIVSTFQIEAPTEEPAAASLPVQISTEVSWDGVLFPLASLPPIFSQFTGTLQVRDLTTQEVVASNTFLFKRSGPTSAGDLILSCNQGGCSLSNPADFLVSLVSSTGADLKAKLLRGRDYAVEVEAKCDHTGNYRGSFAGISGVTGFPGGCFFGAGETASLNSLTRGAANIDFDGMTVAPITITVGDDVTAALGGDCDEDGVADFRDRCRLCDGTPPSPTVVVDRCDSGVANRSLEQPLGCTLADVIDQLVDQEWANHGAFVSAVAELLNGLVGDGVISGREKGKIQSCAAHADIP